jgi:indolepyruvate ferredoxin oxidoreductase
MAGIGCHYMATWVRPEETMTFTQMGGEGVPWVGIQPFTKTEHIFANLGDGTYFHSGLLAVRAAVAAQVNITYKVLFNDAVAMTGGQPVDGTLTVPQITQQLAAEGVKRVVVVSDEPEKYPAGTQFAQGITIYHRDQLDAVQRELREIAGVTALVYDQTCAAEKRRRRKRGTFPDPQKRVVINDHVCEGCGDCSKTSNCLSVVPVETEFGRKRMIDQSSCNKDFSCVKGFCPSFVTVEGGALRKKKAVLQEVLAPLPEPALPALDRPYGILVTGVGGTGVVTIGALLGMAAHLESKGVAVLDMTGLAQKGGSVYTHVRIAKTPEDIHAVRIAAGEASALLGCDMIVSASDEAIAKMSSGLTRGVVNGDVSSTGAFVKNPDFLSPDGDMRAAIVDACQTVDFVDASALATQLMGDSIYTNPFVMGYGYQMGLIPLSGSAIMRAIELNGAAVEANKKAFDWGRRAAVDSKSVQRIAFPADIKPPHHKLSQSLDEIIARRRAHLVEYQDEGYARQYEAFVASVRAAEATLGASMGLTEAVAKYLSKLMAYKDEYEVARLYSQTDFVKRVADQFEGDYKLTFHLAPPLFSKRDPATGELLKGIYGPWMLRAFGILAKFKGLRGGALDVFGKTEERRMERRMISEYRSMIESVLTSLTAENVPIAIEMARLPEHLRGFGHVKEKAARDYETRRGKLMAQFKDPSQWPGRANQRLAEIAVKVAA